MLCVRVHNFAHANLAGLQVLVVLEGVVPSRVLLVGWSVILLERSVLLSHLLLVTDHVVEVEVGEETVVGDGVVGGCGREIVQVGESSGVGGAQPEGHVGVSVVNGVALFALHEAQNVVLHDWVLLDGSRVGTGGLSADAVPDREDILELVVLKGVAVNIDLAVSVADTGVKEELVLL